MDYKLTLIHGSGGVVTIRSLLYPARRRLNDDMFPNDSMCLIYIKLALVKPDADIANKFTLRDR